MKQSSNKSSASSQTSTSSKSDHRRLVVINPHPDLAKSFEQQMYKHEIDVMNLTLPGKVVSIASQAMNEIFSEIAIYEWVLFANAEAAQTFFQGFFEHYKDIRSIGPMRFVTLSPEASEIIKSYHLEVEFEIGSKSEKTPSTSDVIEQLTTQASLENEKVLVVGPGQIIQPIATDLESGALAIVDRYPYEQRESLIGLNLEQAQEFQTHGAHYLLFTDPESVDSFIHHARILSLKSMAYKPKAIALNKSTAQKLRQYQIPVDLELNTDFNKSTAEELMKLLKM